MRYRIRTKEDVEFHSDGFWQAYPAVNVKVYKTLHNLSWPVDDTPEGLTLEWIEEHCSEEDIDRLFWRVCEYEAEYLIDWAKEIFAPYGDIAFEVQGRSGGWIVARNLPDLDSWDAVLLAKWRKFARVARAIADGIPEQMVDSLACNEYEWWLNAQAEEAGIHRDPAPAK